MTGTEIAGLPLLALILFAPWFAILSTLFWFYPRQPRNAARRGFDIVALLLSLVAFIAALYWALGYADPGHHLWPQVLATSVGYGVYLLVMVLAFLLRRRWLERSLSR